MSEPRRRERSPYADVPEELWSDWRWQVHHSLRTAADLAHVLALTDDERQACRHSRHRFRLAVTPYYASLMDPADSGCPIRRQGVPSLAELEVGPADEVDPLAEDRDMPVPGLTHRYPDRVLVYTSHTCAVYCRHCTRRRKVSDPASAPRHDQLDAAVAYIADHPEVRDVVLSGGDPLSLSDDRLDHLLGALRAIPHVEIIRLGTRHPVTLPQRVTPGLCDVLRRHPPIYVNTQFNHPRECTPEAALAASRLVDAGCVLGNQMVLLAGINDDADVVRDLNHALLRMRVRPYYVFQCDHAVGIGHFRVPLERGLQVIDGLRGFTSGLAVPHYVVDLPGGGGKVALQRSAVVRREGTRWVLRGFDGREVVVEDAG